ncbi:GNAT family N-acetyltransferase [Streptomyces sp. NPDC051577]|uniref:GNAT family N-acetyltransferase n=1 Tax=Streptomyces sp. NPDC051577 TaxID=3155166 RepID=UPI00343A3C3F
MTTTFPDVTISTDRLVLRPLEVDDVSALVEMMNDEHVIAWSGAPHPYTRAHGHRWAIRESHAERTEGRGIVLAVTEFLTHRLVGFVRLTNTDWRTLTTEVGYVTAPWARGEGYAGEAVLAVAQWLFHDRGFERLELRTAADNTASQQVAQKIGCISEGVLRNACIVRAQTSAGGWIETRSDLIVWGLVPEDLDDVDGHDGHSGHGDQYAFGQRADASGYPVGADWS